ncbi:MAG: winged helix-turn-helix transcriptional regulator [Actinobacteria bacterium]|nr:winged helix-turn-helix transcriptional regulator [Actinomycetota bacterium]
MNAEDRCELLCLDLPVAEAIRARALERSLELRAAAKRASALADPTRLSLAAALAETEELCVCDLAWIGGRSQNLVSHHVRALRSHGLVDSRRAGKMVMYSLTPAGRALLAAVLPAEVSV